MLKPLGDRVVIEIIETEQKMIGGIVLPDSAKEKPSEGIVVATGAGRILENGTKTTLETKVGDRIVFSKYSGTEVKYDDKEYLILREDDILAIVE
ncbi:co-chaperone GroES [Brochothrix thermosphacta]|uniref:Co-chaperonin GroES n=1 Tax=Brochothrix thermosphacta TaxID=2756 RepID=A0A1D2KXJ8_BROTH|nr:co-chaperone GroES [Brochothrix thermosphacta]ATF26597.1 co-chaperone GroES [Brochothrix thermosphacta]ATH85952.1 co-chaperone GroES [Brochothrix thermosphacta]EUJ37402.1 co-chaperonin GroES [Brochothrix thermosphacta DSM 20171 = FSL F6-1036]MPQ29414.1 co-chaperone GroES [Brochothrix thermosphacta]ODJ48397.1 co-chaperone GroES [Brochothrix thermosphacta DSM 20171 = FSL F6-1036]